MAFCFQPPAQSWQLPCIYVFPLLTQAVVPWAEKHLLSKPSSAILGIWAGTRSGWDGMSLLVFVGVRAGCCTYGNISFAFSQAPRFPL